MFTKTFSALADPNRQKILELLKEKEMAVSEIARHFKITMPTLSHHLDILKRADLVSSRRQGQKILYSLNVSILEEVSQKIINFLRVK
jgi:ArsR family transcriptional regulator, arsenate/arsenite/antimonite-responsive transcriptional repressor